MKKKLLAGLLAGLFLFGTLSAANAVLKTVVGPSASDVDTDLPTLVTLQSFSGGTISDLKLFIDYEANTAGFDVTVTLTHMDTGTSDVIWHDSDSIGAQNFDDVNNTTFDDGASVAFVNAPLYRDSPDDGWDDIVPDSYTPAQPLSAFDGEVFAGTWQLSVQTTGCCSNEGDNLLGWSITADVPSATIQGTISKAAPSGGVMTNAQVFLLNADGRWIDKWVDVDGSGFYRLLDVAEGNYTIVVRPHLYTTDDMYAVTYFDETVSAGINTFNYTIENGGNVSGTIIPDVAPSGNWSDIRVEIWDGNGKYITDGWVTDNSGNYKTSAVAAGDYNIKFVDNNDQYQKEWYNNVPESQFWLASTVHVLLNSVTENIDATLHEPSAANDRYYSGWSDISTVHKRNSETGTIRTYSSAYSQLFRFFNNLPASVDDFDTLTITGATTSCTTNGAINSTSGPDFFADYSSGFELNDMDENGGIGDGVINRPDEFVQPKDWFDAGARCNFGNLPHEGGEYSFELSFLNGRNNGMSINKTLNFSAPLTDSQLPPPSNLVAFWDDTKNELQLSWDMPSYNPVYAELVQIRIYPYRNGSWMHSRFRVNNLPITLNSFTLDNSHTFSFNHSEVEQLNIQIRVYAGAHNTQARLDQSYNFDSTTGHLTPAAIAARPYDINNDGQTGLAESIHILRELTNP